MQLSELKPDAVRLILRLIRAAKGRMMSENQDRVEEWQSVPERTGNFAFERNETLGKTPMQFIRKFGHYVFHSIEKV